MNDVCDMLAMLKRRRQAITPDEIQELLVAAGFTCTLRPDRPTPFYKHPDLPGERITVLVDVSGYVAMNVVGEALGAVRALVVCDEP
jgi:hypothetical protein